MPVPACRAFSAGLTVGCGRVGELSREGWSESNPECWALLFTYTSRLSAESVRVCMKGTLRDAGANESEALDIRPLAKDAVELFVYLSVSSDLLRLCGR